MIIGTNKELMPAKIPNPMKSATGDIAIKVQPRTWSTRNPRRFGTQRSPLNSWRPSADSTGHHNAPSCRHAWSGPVDPLTPDLRPSIGRRLHSFSAVTPRCRQG
jgi:hypothetical protein